jgi:hypothetical protein
MHPYRALTGAKPESVPVRAVCFNQDHLLIRLAVVQDGVWSRWFTEMGLRGEIAAPNLSAWVDDGLGSF